MTATQIDKRAKGITAVSIPDMYRIARALDCASWDLLPLPPLNPEESELVGNLRELAEPERRTVFRIVDALVKSSTD